MKLSKLRHATATRHLAGATIHRQDTTSFGMRHALKKGGSRYAGEACGGEVEGSATRPRLDRPGRKAGGRVCKEEGGKIPVKAKDRSDLEQAVRDEPLSLGNPNALTAGAGAATVYHMLKRSKLPMAIKGPMTAVGTLLAGEGGRRTVNDVGKMMEGTEAASELRKRDAADKQSGGYAKGGFLKMRHPGSLRKALGAKEGETIPAKKLEKAEHSDNPKLRKRAILAETMKSWKHK
jgi:hypothetical protein